MLIIHIIKKMIQLYLKVVCIIINYLMVIIDNFALIE